MNQTKKQSGSVFSKETTVTGEISFEGTLLVAGKVTGTLQGDRVVVNSTAEVRGELIAHSLDCLGTFAGTVVAEQVRMGKTAAVTAEITAQTLAVQPGGALNGTLHMVGAADHGVSVKAAQEKAQPAEGIAESGGSDSPARPSRPAADDAPASQESTLASLEAALAGGSRLIVVISAAPETCQRISDQLEQRLARSGRVGRLDEPTGSFEEVLIRLGAALQIEMIDYSDQQALIESIRSASQKTNQAGGTTAAALVITRVEKMYPATMERILQQLVFPSDRNEEGVPVVLFGGPEVKSMIESEAQNLERFEPDCTFEL